MWNYLVALLLGLIPVGFALTRRNGSVWIPLLLLGDGIALPAVFLYVNPPWKSYKPFGMAVCGKCIAYFERINNMPVDTVVHVEEFGYLLFLIFVITVSVLTIFVAFLTILRKVRRSAD